MKIKIRPLYDRVVIERQDDEPTSKGGIIIPDTAKEKPTRGLIVAVGQGKLSKDGKVIPLAVKVGDVVLIGKYAGTDVKLDSKDYVVLREDDIMAVVDK